MTRRDWNRLWSETERARWIAARDGHWAIEGHLRTALNLITAELQVLDAIQAEHDRLAKGEVFCVIEDLALKPGEWTITQEDGP